MPVRAFLLLLCITVFLATTFARAEDCSCPVVQCEPCQKRLILGSQIKECSKSPAVVCQKIVCENVDNYFQCIAGAPPLYIPPVDPSTRYTEPRFNADTKPHEIDFEKLATVPDAKPDATSSAVKFEAPSPSLKVREPASVVKAPEAPAAWTIVLAKLSGEIYHGKKRLGKKGTFRSSVALHAKKKSQISARFAQDVIQITFEKGSSAEFSVQDDVLMVRNVSGEARFQVDKSQDLFVADLGAWRFGKKSGSFKIGRDGSSTFLTNIAGDAYLRRETLISHADVIRGEVTYKFDDGADLYSVLPSQKDTKVSYSLQETSERDVASSPEPEADAFCGSPAGQYEQCAWKCFGAASGAKTCANASAAAKCVRFTCAADGQWKLPTVVSQGECSLDRIHVGICH